MAQGYALAYPQSLSKLVLADTLHSAEMWQKGNNDTTNREIENQTPEVWADIQQLRAKGGKSCDAAYQEVEARIPLSLFYFFDRFSTTPSSDPYADAGVNRTVRSRRDPAIRAAVPHADAPGRVRYVRALGTFSVHRGTRAP